MKHPTLYKIDSKGKTRIWWMEANGSDYRTVSGVQDGSLVTTKWTTAKAKNTGRANATSAESQATAEILSQYKKKTRGTYHDTIEGAVQGAKFFEPMLAVLWDKRKDKIDYSAGVFIQPKLDGIRCIVTKDGAFTKTGKRVVTAPHIVSALQPVFDQHPDYIFDGELYNHALRDDFNEITSLVTKTKPSMDDLAKTADIIQYHVYDFPGNTSDAFSVRYDNLTNTLKSFNIGNQVQIVPTAEASDEGNVDALYAEYMALGFEGGIVRLNGVYVNRRTNNLIKRKDFTDQEFTIVRVLEGTGNWSGVAKVVVFINDITGKENKATIQGSRSYCEHVLKNADQYVGKQATVKYFNRTPAPEHAPRHPIAKVLHLDERW